MGGGGGVEPERRIEGQKFTRRVENTIMIDSTVYLQSITLINKCRKVPLQVNVLDDDILLWCLYSSTSK